MPDLVKATLLAATAMIVFAAAAALARDPLCAGRSEIVGQLSARYGEAPAGFGIANNGGVVELLMSRDGRGWTIILTMPSGVTCMLAAGENWEVLPPGIAGAKT